MTAHCTAPATEPDCDLRCARRARDSLNALELPIIPFWLDTLKRLSGCRRSGS